MSHGRHCSGNFLEYAVFEGGYSLCEPEGSIHGVMLRDATDNSTDFLVRVVNGNWLPFLVSQNGNDLRNEVDERPVPTLRAPNAVKLGADLGALSAIREPAGVVAADFLSVSAIFSTSYRF